MKSLKERLTGNCFTPQRTQSGWELNRMESLKECQIIKSVNTLDWDLNEFEIVGYACGDKIDVNINLTWDHFEYAYPMKTSSNSINKSQFYHFFCTQDDQETFVVAKRNN